MTLFLLIRYLKTAESALKCGTNSNFFVFVMLHAAIFHDGKLVSELEKLWSAAIFSEAKKQQIETLIIQLRQLKRF